MSIELANAHCRLPGRSDALARRLAGTALAHLDDASVSALSADHERLLEDPATEEGDVLLLLTRQFSLSLPIPDYYRYTTLHVVEWFLSQHDDAFGASLLAIHATLTELSRLERKEAGRHTTVPEHLVERLRRLHPLIDQVTEMYIAPYSPLRGVNLVEGVDGDEQLARGLTILKRCTGFRRSDKHDEHVFLRMVIACELVFYMIRWTARQAIRAIGEDRAEFLFRMGQLTACSELLSAIFHVLRTLSPELFLSFREETGNASAVQSMNYHLMELVVYGYDGRKEEIFTKLDHLRPIRSDELRAFRSLRDVVTESGDQELVDAFRAVDRALLTWRGRHYGFGRAYLPDMQGSGGTEGAAYLKRFVNKDGLPSGARLRDTEDLLSRFAFC
ncbi:hypothetical protein BLA60_21165 [Actinophytocola xinjiangensis]|uniref:Tryptophan 2,3-dioxygenase n=1 Tax=Actinophytocola xinjiangensis TaxID=485602 RepID=A0A7Z0WK07_9PSEU|nr:tryptophan 2,3-dioxygenase family protein [Actinophytocola xinjiangensis]OLF09096.1 hypothetical protein BLA60_21165 [Actinophytocola xinjiangensis]